MSKLNKANFGYRFGRAIAAACFALLACSQLCLAGFTSEWFAASGLYPNQLNPAWNLEDTATPEDPVLASGKLTISTSPREELMGYFQSNDVLNTSGPFFFEARVRFISGSSINASRAPINLHIETAPFVGNALFIAQDEVWFNAGDLVKGPTTNVDTDVSFHTYRIDFNGINTLTLTYDGTPILTGTTFTNPNFTDHQILIWGENSSLALGTSEWEFVRHNALTVMQVPEPSATLFFGSAALVLAVCKKRFRR